MRDYEPVNGKGRTVANRLTIYTHFPLIDVAKDEKAGKGQSGRQGQVRGEPWEDRGDGRYAAQKRPGDWGERSAIEECREASGPP